MNTHFTYFLILVLSLLGPFALSFDKKVAFYKQWRYVFPAMILPAVFFIVWDIIFTNHGVWSFNPQYITGIYIGSIPLEEALFFFIVPYCCVFIYECIRCYFPRLQNKNVSVTIFVLLATVLLIVGFLHQQAWYTFYTTIFTGVFILLLLLLYKKIIPFFNFTAFLIAYLIILLPFLAVNGVLTYLPVVMYNDAHNLGLRIITIPAEDIFYGMLLVLMNIVIFEKLRSRKAA